MSVNPTRAAAALTQAITAALPPLPPQPAPPPLAPAPLTPQSTLRSHQSPTPSLPRPNFPPRPRSSHSAPSTQNSPVPNPLKAALKPAQLSAARLLLAGHTITDTAAALRIDRYTISRWKKSPAFQAELRRQTDALARHTAQHSATARHNSTPFWQNEENEAMRQSVPLSPLRSTSSSASRAPQPPPHKHPAPPSATSRHKAQHSQHQKRRTNPFLDSILSALPPLTPSSISKPP